MCTVGRQAVSGTLDLFLQLEYSAVGKQSLHVQLSGTLNLFLQLE